MAHSASLVVHPSGTAALAAAPVLPAVKQLQGGRRRLRGAARCYCGASALCRRCLAGQGCQGQTPQLPQHLGCGAVELLGARRGAALRGATPKGQSAGHSPGWGAERAGIPHASTKQAGCTGRAGQRAWVVSAPGRVEQRGGLGQGRPHVSTPLACIGLSAWYAGFVVSWEEQGQGSGAMTCSGDWGVRLSAAVDLPAGSCPH